MSSNRSVQLFVFFLLTPPSRLSPKNWKRKKKDEAKLLYRLLIAFQSVGRSCLSQLECQRRKQRRKLFYAAAFKSAVVSASIVQRTIWRRHRGLVGEDSDGDRHILDWVWNLHAHRQTFDFICGGMQRVLCLCYFRPSSCWMWIENTTAFILVFNTLRLHPWAPMEVV